MEGFVVLLKNREIHCFKERVDYLAFVKDRKDIAWLFGNPMTFYDTFLECVGCRDALEWLDEIDSDERDRILDDMEYGDAKETLLKSHQDKDEDGDE